MKRAQVVIEYIIILAVVAVVALAVLAIMGKLPVLRDDKDALAKTFCTEQGFNVSSHSDNTVFCTTERMKLDNISNSYTVDWAALKQAYKNKTG